MDSRYNDAMTKHSTLFDAKQNHRPAIRAYLGGSFNPVHNAHIEMAMLVYDSLAPIATEQQCKLQVSLLPNARSPFKLKSTAPKHRLAMLKLAIVDTPLRIDELELWQQPPVYTIDSVRNLRQRYPEDVLIFIMGMDSARSLEQWKQGLDLTDYVHLWLFDRHDPTKPITTDSKLKDTTKLTEQLPLALQQQVTGSFTELLAVPKPLSKSQDPSKLPLKSAFKGRIYLDTRALATLSSTEIRKQLLTSAIETQNQPKSATNTAIKQNSLSKSLNPAVYHYIVQHKLYSVG